MTIEFEQNVLIPKVDEYVLGNQDWLDDGVEVSFMADDKDIRVYVVNTHEQYDAIEKFIDDTFEVHAYSLDLVRITFYDEVMGCHECYGQINTTPSSAFWHSDWWIGDGFCFCKDCVKEVASEEYIDHLTNNYKNANVILDHEELVNNGWERLEYEYTAGMNHGYSENPENVYEHLKDDYENIIFSITSTTPFDTSFSVYVKKTEEE